MLTGRASAGGAGGDVKLYIPDGSGGVKGVSLRNLPQGAWRTVYGKGPTSGIIKLYESIPWLYRAVNLRAAAISNMPYSFVLPHGDEVTENELPQPQRAIIEQMQLPTMLDQAEGWLSLYGAAYYLIIRSVANTVLGLRPMLPSSITPIINEQKGLVGFKRNLSGQHRALKVEDVLYIWSPSRSSELGTNVAPAVAALNASQLLGNLTEYEKAFFLSGTISPFILSVEGNMQAEERQGLQKMLGTFAQGIRNAFRTHLVNNKVTVTQLGSKISELAQDDLTRQAREDVATALGIPHSLLFSNAANFATARQDDINFYDKTIIPEMGIIAAAMNAQVFGSMGLKFKPRPDKLEIYQRQEAEKAAALGDLVVYGIVTVDEARQQLGLEPLRPREEPMPALPIGNGNGSGAIVEATARETPAGAVQEELRKWRTKAIRRHDEGNPEKALDFDSNILSPVLHTYIRTQLQGATGRQDINNIFSAARLWDGYP